MKNFMKSKEKRLAVLLKSGFITQRKYDELFKIKASNPTIASIEKAKSIKQNDSLTEE